MSIQKKSLLSGLNATKKAIVASSTTASQGNPSVNAPIAARVLPKASARVLPKASARVLPKASARVLPKARTRALALGRTRALALGSTRALALGRTRAAIGALTLGFPCDAVVELATIAFLVAFRPLRRDFF